MQKAEVNLNAIAITGSGERKKVKRPLNVLRGSNRYRVTRVNKLIKPLDGAHTPEQCSIDNGSLKNIGRRIQHTRIFIHSDGFFRYSAVSSQKHIKAINYNRHCKFVNWPEILSDSPSRLR